MRWKPESCVRVSASSSTSTAGPRRAARLSPQRLTDPSSSQGAPAMVATARRTGRPLVAPPQVDKMPVRRVVAFLAMVFGMFMSILDIQIVSASLAEIQAGLGAGADEIAWVQTSYLIAEVIMIPLSGTLARIVSTRVLF